MHPRDKIIVIGAGHNGLVTAAYLAKAGLKPVVLERREIVGGGCITEEIHPGFRCSTLTISTGPLLPRIIKDLQLERHGLAAFKPSVRVFAPNTNGHSVCIYEDAKRTADSLTKVSAKDTKAYPDFLTSFARIGRALAPKLQRFKSKMAKQSVWSCRAAKRFRRRRSSQTPTRRQLF